MKPITMECPDTRTWCLNPELCHTACRERMRAAAECPRTEHARRSFDVGPFGWWVEEQVARELERELLGARTAHAALLKECSALLDQMRVEVQKHDSDPEPTGFSWLRYCELSDRLNCLLCGIK